MNDQLSIDHDTPLALVRYEAMRLAIQQCATIDEAADMRDKAAALAAYARQRDDTEVAVWFSEIRLRATIRIGELVRELDKAPPGPELEDTSKRRDITDLVAWIPEVEKRPLQKLFSGFPAISHFLKR